jgi:hypothetical protein
MYNVFSDYPRFSKYYVLHLFLLNGCGRTLVLVLHYLELFCPLKTLSFWLLILLVQKTKIDWTSNGDFPGYYPISMLDVFKIFSMPQHTPFASYT